MRSMISASMRLSSRAVIALFRSRGLSPNDAEDLAQEFFLVALKRNFLEKADRERGRFRGYLRTAAKRFSISHQRKASRRSRYSSTVAATLSCGPSSAMIAAIWIGWKVP